MLLLVSDYYYVAGFCKFVGRGRLPKCLSLTKNYRNSLPIQKLYQHIVKHHQSKCPPLKKLASHDCGSEHPPGTTPVWITVYGEVTDEEVLDYVKSHPDYKGRLQKDSYQVAEIGKIGDDWKLR